MPCRTLASSCLSAYGGALLYQQGRLPHVRPCPRRRVPRPRHPQQRRLPGFNATAHGKREIAVLSRYGVDVSDAAIAAAQGRLCRPEEVAAAALFLASDEASLVNGAHLFADNGFTAI